MYLGGEGSTLKNYILFLKLYTVENFLTYPFKGQCHEISDLYLYSWIKPIWVPDKQANMIFLKN